MRLAFADPKLPPLDVDDANLLGVLEPRALEVPPPLSSLIERALDAPFGSGPLQDYASSSSRVLVLVDDAAKPTPAWGILPSLFRRLVRAGCKRKNVRLLIASGIHGPMSQEEVEAKLGARIPSEHQVSLHDWKDPKGLFELSTMADGTPIRVNRLLREADLLVGVGQVVPHRVIGFTGGSSIVQPGVSGPEITAYTHWLSALYPGREILGVADNPVRAEVERVGQKAGLRFVVNVILDGEDRVAHAVAGDPVAAFRQGVEYSQKIHSAPLAAPADIVVADCYPARNLWQAAKGAYAAELAVREGGVVILVAPCPRGVSREHPEIEMIGYHHYTEVKAMVEKKQINDLIAAAHLAHVGRVIRDKAHGILVASGIDPETQGHLGFEPARTPQQALEMALAIAGPAARVAFLRQADTLLPVLQPNGRKPSPTT